MQVLRQRWPNYEADVGATLFSFARRVLDWRVRRIYGSAAQHMPRPRVLRIATKPGVRGPESDHEILELTRLGDTWILHGATGNCLESVSTALPDAPMAAAWLQRHAIERIESDATVDRQVAEVFVAQARRLGIAVPEVSVPAQTTQGDRAAATPHRIDEAHR
jgi:hypothetical protein